ncbi:MAG: hypothetical protein IPL71_12100 [Anaerolineales bacterium]|uniref:hypothetical protein n=1 Tax=Candidatus Villigracilis proximus TaxID=3140683 RepID=UPI00313730D7|nr:hypothetical protein [Anaerolineales bacterium]
MKNKRSTHIFLACLLLTLTILACNQFVAEQKPPHDIATVPATDEAPVITAIPEQPMEASAGSTGLG